MLVLVSSAQLPPGADQGLGSGREYAGALVSVLGADGSFLRIGDLLQEQLVELGVAAPARLRDLIHAEDEEAVRAAWDRVVAGARHAQVVARCSGTHGTRWLQLQLGRDAVAQRIQLCTADVSASVETTQRCALYQKAFDTLPMMIAISDEQGCFRLVNQGYADHYGYPHHDMIGQPFTMIIQPAERARWMQWHHSIIAGTIEPGREAPVAYRNGRTGFVAVTAERLQLADGSRYRMTTISDVTERRRIAQREQLLSVILRGGPVVTFVTDNTGRVTHLEGRAAERAGFSADRALGQHLSTVIPETPELTEALHRALAGEETTLHVVIGELSCDIWLCPCRGADAQVTMVVGTLLDVTERVRSARLLGEQLSTIARQSEMISRLLLPILPVWPGVLCVPLLSEAGEALGAYLKEALLAAVVRSRARLILLDLTGIVRLTENTAAQLVSLAVAVRLLGARTRLTGVSPQVARALVTSGAELSGLRSYATLHEGLRACIAELPQSAGAVRDRSGVRSGS